MSEDNWNEKLQCNEDCFHCNDMDCPYHPFNAWKDCLEDMFEDR